MDEKEGLRGQGRARVVESKFLRDFCLGQRRKSIQVFAVSPSCARKADYPAGPWKRRHKVSVRTAKSSSAVAASTLLYTQCQEIYIYKAPLSPSSSLFIFFFVFGTFKMRRRAAAPRRDEIPSTGS